MAARTGRRPLIGITASRGRGRIMTLLNRLAVWRAGGRPRVLRPGDGWRRPGGLDGFAGFVIGGGDDIDVALYADGLTLDTRVDPERDALEMAVLDRADAAGLPVLGICRGAQMLVVHAGGSLHTDVHAVYGDAPRLRTILPRKAVTLTPGSQLAALLGRAATTVNALHHQAVDRLGRGYVVSARDAHGIVQAIERPDPPWRLGVQWHPEFLFYAGHQARLFAALVARAAGR